MSLKRLEIRNKMKEILKGRTAVGDNVFANPSVPSWIEELPIILIYNRSESVDLYSTAPREWEHVTSIAVEIIAEGKDDMANPGNCRVVSDVLDEIGEQVVCEFSRDSTLRNTVDEFNWVSTEFNYEGEGNRPVGVHIMIFEAKFYTGFPQSFDKVQGASDLKGANVDWQVGHHDDDPDDTNQEATDIVDIEA